MTSYYTGDSTGSGSVTGSGLKSSDFQVNEHGWYTYQGKLVVATATTYLLNYGYARRDGIVYHKYYETLTLTINGKDYPAIILDSCGACMKKPIIDIFVKDRRSVIDTYITVK